jgi:hypothetical protein
MGRRQFAWLACLVRKAGTRHASLRSCLVRDVRHKTAPISMRWLCYRCNTVNEDASDICCKCGERKPELRSSRPLTQDGMRRLLLWCFIPSGIVLIPWPLLAFGTIFIFDAPFRSSTDMCIRYLAAGSIFLYPLIWGGSLAVAVASKRKEKKERFMMALLSPYCWIVIAAVLMASWNHLATSIN